MINEKFQWKKNQIETRKHDKDKKYTATAKKKEKNSIIYIYITSKLLDAKIQLPFQ